MIVAHVLEASSSSYWTKKTMEVTKMERVEVKEICCPKCGSKARNEGSSMSTLMY